MSKISIESQSVQSYLTILQEVISRMANNSAGSKTWCIALVSAILIVIADKNSHDLIWIAFVPIGLFSVLDAYYLGYERRFRDHYNSFIIKLHNNEVEVEDVFVVTPAGKPLDTIKYTIKSIGSFSVWPFYSVLIFVTIVFCFIFQP